MRRRTLMAGAALLPLWGYAQGGKRNRDEAAALFESGVRRVEARVGGRLGAAVLDTRTGAFAMHRGGERFALCSTFKLLLAAQILRRVDQGQERLDARVRFGRGDLVAYSPRTGPHAGGEGMTVAQLCEAAMVLSDNSAANLLLRRQGGPEGLTAWLRSLGDAHTRLDRMEPELNDVRPGDVRDTTTPLAMLHTLQALVLGEALSPASRVLLQDWLLGNLTGDKRLRAGMPPGWRVGEKTGTSDGVSSDVGVIWPAQGEGAPAVVACYLAECPAGPALRDAAIAEAGALAAEWIKAS